MKSLWASKVKSLMIKELANHQDTYFYSKLLEYIEIVPTHSMPTFALVGHNKRLLINPYFASKLNLQELSSIFKHEIHHYVNYR